MTRTVLGTSFLLALHLALALLLSIMGLFSNHRTFSVQALSAPDQTLLLGANVALGLFGALLQAANLFRLDRTNLSLRRLQS